MEDSKIIQVVEAVALGWIYLVGKMLTPDPVVPYVSYTMVPF